MSLNRFRLAASVMSAALPEPCLCLVTDRSLASSGDLVRWVSLAVGGGVDLVQLREKDLPGSQFLKLATELRSAIGTHALLIVNGRADLAAEAGAQGVQLGEEAMTVGAARKLLPSGSLVGRSVHTVEAALSAVSEGADFLLVGTMYATDSHPGVPPDGPALMRAVAQDCRIPLIGIGGITRDNLSEVIAAGASGVAVIRSILAAPDPRGAARELKQSLADAWRSRPSLTNPQEVRSE
jgi:thiamine-phosphate pyrophosphorylase